MRPAGSEFYMPDVNHPLFTPASSCADFSIHKRFVQLTQRKDGMLSGNEGLLQEYVRFLRLCSLKVVGISTQICFTGWLLICFTIENKIEKHRPIFVDKLCQRGPTGGPRVTSGPRPLVTRPAKLFVNLLLVTSSLFSLFRRIWKISRFLPRLLLYVGTSATHVTDFKTQP
jgi:hypothetical protein